MSFCLLSSVIHAHIADLFTGREVLAYSQFRVTRDSDLWVDEEEVKNLRQALQGRTAGPPVRLRRAAGSGAQLPARRCRNFLLDQFCHRPQAACTRSTARSTWCACWS